MVDFIRTNLKLSGFLVIAFISHFAVYTTVFLDIPIARQVVCFLYLTFVPGMILLRILKLDRLDATEKILFSAGLSIAFLMVVGLLMNELLPLIGVSRPLSEVPLILVLSGVTLSLCFVSTLKEKESKSPIAEKSRLFPLAIPLFICLPVLSVVGVTLVNASQGNAILLFMILMIAGLVVLGTFSKKFLPPKLFPLALCTIAVAILFHTSLISNYIQGQNDFHYEYYLAESTKNSLNWSSEIPWQILATDFGVEYSKFNGMLSITILPSIYSVVLKMDMTSILKIIYPLIFSFVPLGLYRLFNIKVKKETAFLATFFFMAYDIFFTEMLGLARQMIAELFFVLLFFLLYNEKINSTSKTVCFIIFGFALVVSHYAISYFFMFLIFFTWFFLFLMKNRSRRITATLVALIFVISFCWYIYVSASGPYKGIIGWGRSVYNSFGDLFNIGSREADIKRGLGMEVAPSSWYLIGRTFAYITEFFIVFGFITVIRSYLKQRNPRARDREYVVLLSLSMALLLISIFVPGFSEYFRMARFYHVLLFFLAPICIIGAETFFKLMLNLKSEDHILPSVLILIVLIPYFLFQTGFVYEVTGDVPSSIPLSKYRMGSNLYVDMKIVDEQDVFGAEWLSKYVDVGRTPIYADQDSRSRVLSSYGMVGNWRTQQLTNTTTISASGVVYLSQLNTVYEIFKVRYWRFIQLWNTTEISSIYHNLSKVYSNGSCEIYKDQSSSGSPP